METPIPILNDGGPVTFEKNGCCYDVTYDAREDDLSMGGFPALS